MNNFCGLGAIGPGQQGAHFPSPQIGTRAHIQHLKAYATDAPLRQELVDPRYRMVRYGSAPTLDGLAGSWATDRDYSRKIKSILERLYAFALTPREPANEPVQSAEAQPEPAQVQIVEVQAEPAQIDEIQVNEAKADEIQEDKVLPVQPEGASMPIPTAETLPESAAGPVSALGPIPNAPAQSGGS
jgi:hypothetical protein